ncbi:MAG: GNAT family N-acetyltransferase [Lysobacterales bacterium]
MTEHRREEDGLTFSTDPARLDIDLIHSFLSGESYWVPDIRREHVETAIAHSLCFGVYDAAGQVAFARVVSDRAGFAYLADVFVLPRRRGEGIGKRLMAYVLAHPELQRLRRFLLATRDAHGLYAQFGFRPLAAPERFLERYDADALSR